MNIWSGSITLKEESRLEGLRLIDPTPNLQSDISKDSILNLRCFVNPALIPLYARTGPNLEVHTAKNETSEWLKSKLLGNIWCDGEELEAGQSLQCPVGFLVAVDGPRRPVSGVTVTTSDLLIYGVLSCTPAFERPPTPPVSSSSGNYDHIPSIKRELRIYAAPLAASLISKAQSLPSPPHSPTDSPKEDVKFAEFLPDFRSPSPKRKRVATLFESAAQHHRRVRQKGGEAVSQMMAGSQQSIPGIKRESEEPSAVGRGQRSKSVSGNINPWRQLDLRPGISRPNSARGLHSLRKSTPSAFLEPTSGQRISSPHPSGRDDSWLQKNDDAIITENKNIIARTILTCMRLYGFNRPRAGKHGAADLDGQLEKDSGTPAPEGPMAASMEEDEFKSMYHATYRASTFALRKYLKESSDRTPPLVKGKAMGYIDEFLRLFCEESGEPGQFN